MVRIGICDDEKAVVYQLKEILENILQDINTEYEIFCYFSASDLLKNIANLNLIFLDIEMPEMEFRQEKKFTVFTLTVKS